MLVAVILSRPGRIVPTGHGTVEALVLGPPDDAGGPGPQGAPDHHRTGGTSGGGGGLPSDERRRTLTRARDLRRLGSAVTALRPAACSVATSEAQVDGVRYDGNDADTDRPGAGRLIEGRGPWTHR